MIKESVVCAPLDAIAQKEHYQLGDQNVAINDQAWFVSSEEINRQVKKVLQLQLTPILYINEGASRLLPAAFAETVSYRLMTILAGIPQDERQKIVFAYSPQWLSQPVSHEEIWTLHLNHRALRDILDEFVDPHARLAYAGPLDHLIAEELAGDFNIDGVVNAQNKGENK